jgi:hypothetical protein
VQEPTAWPYPRPDQDPLGCGVWLFAQAVFDGGDYCHKHPARSLRVKLECGGEERAWDASEPSTCAYTVHASTPAACKADTLKELQVRLRPCS